ncbi:MAG: DUF1223 domain-containing protein [Pseudomonadota bacterium]
MTRFLALFACAVAWLSPSALAQERPVLVELFASQNCKACPKAYRLLDKIKTADESVFVLTWTVDYWDYLGDPDPMALSEAKTRQEAYADNLAVRAPYTPQSVYNGALQCPATRERQIKKQISKTRDMAEAKAPRLTETATGVSIAQPCDTPMDLVLVEYLSDAAHTSDRVNPVTGTWKLGTCGSEPAEFDIACGASCAVFLQAPDYGPIMDTLVLATR